MLPTCEKLIEANVPKDLIPLRHELHALSTALVKQLEAIAPNHEEIDKIAADLCES